MFAKMRFYLSEYWQVLIVHAVQDTAPGDCFLYVVHSAALVCEAASLPQLLLHLVWHAPSTGGVLHVLSILYTALGTECTQTGVACLHCGGTRLARPDWHILLEYQGHLCHHVSC